MANRRMLAKSIVRADYFMDMPATTQLLYVHLNLEADDDGFVSNPKRVIRTLGSYDDDFKILLAKGFIIPFESGICVIKDWNIHNYIQNDRYTMTTHLKEKSMLVREKNRAYTLCIQEPAQNVSKMDTLEMAINNDKSLDTKRIKDVSETDTQYRLTRLNNKLGEGDFSKEKSGETFIEIAERQEKEYAAQTKPNETHIIQEEKTLD